MKPSQKQHPFVSIHISPSTPCKHTNPLCNVQRTKSKKRNHMLESQCSLKSINEKIQKRKIHKNQSSSNEILSTYSKDGLNKSKHKDRFSIKPMIIDREVKEEYNLDYKQSKQRQNTCTDPLHSCKYIDHYIGTIKHQLKEQKRKNSELKRRNRELTHENIMFNEYFEVFEERYRNLKEECSSREGSSRAKQKNVAREYSKSKERTVVTNKHHHYNSDRKQMRSSEAESRFEYMGNRSEHEKDKKMKMNSCMTTASSRQHSHSGGNYIFPSMY